MSRSRSPCRRSRQPPAEPGAQAQDATLKAAGLIGEGALYRKIDSTLRGHVGVEVAATLQAAGPGAFVIVCPGYPTMGRVVRDGQVFVRGAPLQETEIWRHEGHGDADFGAMLTGAGLTVAHIPLAIVRQGPEALAVRFAEVAPGAPKPCCAGRRERGGSQRPGRRRPADAGRRVGRIRRHGHSSGRRPCRPAPRRQASP